VLHHAAKAYVSLADYPSALRIARLAQNKAAEDGDSILLAEIFVTLARTLRSLGELKETEKALRDAESIFRRNDCLEGQSRVLNLLAGHFYRQHEYKNALSSLMDAIDITRSLGDQTKLAFMMGNIGRIHTFVGDYDEAEKHLNTNIEMSSELGDWLEVTRAKIALGYVHLLAGEYDRAEETLDAAYTGTVEFDSARDEAICLTYLGELRYRRGRLEEARVTLLKALDTAEKIEPGTTLGGRVMRHLAELYLRLGNHRTARRYLSKAAPIMQKADNQVELGVLQKVGAAVAAAEGRESEARKLFAEAIATLEAAGVRAELADALVAAGQSPLYLAQRRLTLLFRAEEFYAGKNLAAKRREVEKLIADVDYSGGIVIAPSSETGDAIPAEVDFLTNCEEIREFLRQLIAISRAELALLLTGETGVGKDHMARYFHQIARPGTPFVAINCASVPATLLESELFGYRRGAFTGAELDKQGLFVAANGGMLLLDEIGDMPLTLQTKLLGVLESKKVTPLGSTNVVELDIKLVAATNKPLEDMVENGEFRRDLYYRLSGWSYHIPALRERKEDIPLLLTHFLRQCRLLSDSQKPPPELVRRFLAYDWPGNTRELFNKVKRLEVMLNQASDQDLVELSRAALEADSQPTTGSLFERVEQFERQLIMEALIAAGGNKSEAARLLGIHEATVRTKLKRYDISLQSGLAS
jgi:transcriptional regulator with AAA-type ATPase domain/tetratricopeptide (TPR) repeat protein